MFKEKEFQSPVYTQIYSPHLAKVEQSNTAVKKKTLASENVEINTENYWIIDR